MKKTVLITGGGGYVGSALVPKLLKLNYKVKVIDLFIYGEDTLNDHINLEKIKGDIRNIEILKSHLINTDIVIHLACISNDPSFELNPLLGKSINLDPFEPLVKLSKEAGVKRFIYASSSSVYGIKTEKNVHEDMSLEPLTDYSLFKAECEKILNLYSDKNFTTTTIRPATVCGYSKRQRLDVVVNILSNLAFHKREITIFGGDQLRPNIHIDDMVEAYITLINADSNLVNGEIFNAGYENQSVNELAFIVKKVIGKDVNIIKNVTDDNRSYHISSDKIYRVLSFKPKKSIEDAVIDLKNAFEKKLLNDPLNNIEYFNIKKMQFLNLK